MRVVKSPSLSRRARRLLVLAIVAVLAACSSSEGAPVTATAEDLGHIHDVIVNDGTVFLASHSGIFRVEGPDRAILLGQHRHDFMAMDGADGRLVGSGHPDLRFDEWRVSGKPAHLGFVVSDDGGESWSSVALLGEVDFHSLTTLADGGYLGADSAGAILASQTGAAWETRSTLYVTDLAASPVNAAEVLAIDGETGLLLVSSDGARTWAALANAPTLARVQWNGDGVVGVAADGSLYTTDTPAEDWTRIGEVDGRPVAFTVQGGEWWIVTEEAVVIHTSDGAAFDTIYTAPQRSTP